jgi:hypothetical protein
MEKNSILENFKKTPYRGKTSHKMSSTFHQRYWYYIGEVPKSFHFLFPAGMHTDVQKAVSICSVRVVTASL